MKILPSIVRVKKIEAPQLQTHFSETELEKAAQLILEMEGVVIPLILLRTEPESESYRIIDGHFEYYAALKAMEIDSRKGSKINAYIIESEEEKAAYEQQIEMFRQRKSIQSQTPLLPSPPEPVSPVSIEPIELNEAVPVDRLAVIEKTVMELASVKDTALHDAVAMMKTFIGDQMDHFGNQIRQTFDSQIKALSDQMKDLQASLETQKSVTIPTPPVEPQVKEEKPTPPSVIPEQKFLKELNEPLTPELTLKLKGALEMVGLKNKIEEVINRIKSERQKWPFQNIADMRKRVRGTGLGPKKIEEIVNHWY